MTIEIKNNKNNNCNFPTLRFPEFSGEWKKDIIGNVISVKSEKYNPHSNRTEFICVELESISQGTGELLETFNSAEQKSIKNKFSPGTVLFGKLRPYLRKFYLPYFEGVCSSEIWVMRSNKIEPAFLYSFIQTPYFISLANQSSGSKMPRADWGLIETSKIAYPPNSAERVKIGKFLKLIDERIATQNKIIAHLESLIKGLSDTLLENPLWQKTYLRSFMQFYSTNSLSWGQLSYEEGEIRNLHYGLIHSFQTSEIDTDSLPRILPANVPKQYTLCQAGDVAFADASEDTDEIGKAVEFIRTHKASVICGLHTIHGRDIKCKTLLGFKRVAFNSHYFHDQIKRLAQGTKVFSITSSNLSSCYIYIPDIVMQKSIVVLFEAYEEQLITNKRLLEQYEKQKRYLLQQMFI